MPLSLPITGVQHQGTSIQGISKATIIYTLNTSLGELLINRRPLSFQISLDPDKPFPSAKDIANLIATDVNTKFGSKPTTVTVEKTPITPTS